MILCQAGIKSNCNRTVHAVEPLQVNIRWMRAQYRLLNNLRTHHGALGDERRVESVPRVTLSGNQVSTDQLVQPQRGQRHGTSFERFQVDTLDTMLRGEHVGFLHLECAHTHYTPTPNTPPH